VRAARIAPAARDGERAATPPLPRAAALRPRMRWQGQRGCMPCLAHAFACF